MWLKVDRGEFKFRTPLEERTRQAGWNVFSAKPLRVVTDWIVCIVSCTWGTTWTFCLGNKWKSLARPSGSLWSSLWKDLSSLVPSTGNQLFSSSLPVGAKKAGAWEPTVYTTSQLWLSDIHSKWPEWDLLHHRSQQMPWVKVPLPTASFIINQDINERRSGNYLGLRGWAITNFCLLNFCLLNLIFL